MSPRIVQTVAAAALLGMSAAALSAQQYSEVASGTGASQITAGREVKFTIRIENVSTPQTLKLSNGQTAPAPTAPGLWIVQRGGEPVFSAGHADRRMGLEQLAEDGDPSGLAGKLAGVTGVVTSGVFSTPIGDSRPGPALPGKAFEFTITAAPGDRLSIAMMFGQSNDLFYAFDAGGLELFPNGKPVAGDITQRLALWDAGTEVNEEPGLGPNQAPRQSAPNTGPSEHEPVQLVSTTHDGFRYPAVGDVVRVTITPATMSASTSK